MPVTIAQAYQLAVKLKPEGGPEQGALLYWIDKHSRVMPAGWSNLEEEQVKSMLQFVSAKSGEQILTSVRMSGHRCEGLMNRSCWLKCCMLLWA